MQPSHPTVPATTSLTPEEWRRRTARTLAFAGAALFAFAAWAPWMTGNIIFSLDQLASPPNSSPFSYDSSLGVYLLLARLFRNAAVYDPETTSRLLSFAWGGVTAIGVLLAPLLWLRLRQSSSFRPLTAFIAWLAVATLATLALVLVIWRYQPTTQLDFAQIALTNRSVGWGLWLALLGLSAAWIGAALLYRESKDEHAAPEPNARPPFSAKRRVAAVGLFSASIALWFFGFLAIPWVEVNCDSLQLTLNHLVDGACGQLDSADALSSQLVQQVSANTWNLSEGIYPLYGALIGGAVLLFIAVWRRPDARVVSLWAALWLAVASGTAFLAYRGVGVVITSSPALTTEASGVWNGATGVAVTLFGLLLGWLAILPMEGARWWSIGANVPPPPPRPPVETYDPFAASGDDFEVTRLPL